MILKRPTLNKFPINKSQGIAKCFVYSNSVSRDIVPHSGAWYFFNWAEFSSQQPLWSQFEP